MDPVHRPIREMQIQKLTSSSTMTFPVMAHQMNRTPDHHYHDHQGRLNERRMTRITSSLNPKTLEAERGAVGT